MKNTGMVNMCMENNKLGNISNRSRHAMCKEYMDSYSCFVEAVHARARFPPYGTFLHLTNHNSASKKSQFSYFLTKMCKQRAIYTFWSLRPWREYMFAVSDNLNCIGKFYIGFNVFGLLFNIRKYLETAFRVTKLPWHCRVYLCPLLQAWKTFCLLWAI
jgi:hypothetical protein